MENPYVVEREKNGCGHCGGGARWTILYKPACIGWSSSFEGEAGREHAQELADDLNEAYKRGFDAAKEGRTA